jgi:hypothetical protein
MRELQSKVKEREEQAAELAGKLQEHQTAYLEQHARDRAEIEALSNKLFESGAASIAGELLCLVVLRAARWAGALRLWCGMRCAAPAPAMIMTWLAVVCAYRRPEGKPSQGVSSPDSNWRRRRRGMCAWLLQLLSSIQLSLLLPLFQLTAFNTGTNAPLCCHVLLPACAAAAV